MRKYSVEQLKAINTRDKHTALIAGAGTGKTTVLIARIKKIINSGANPNNILAITFTKKAANEMKQRLSNIDVLVMTFDAFCFHLTNKDFIVFKDDNTFSKKELLAFNIYDANLKTGKVPSKYNEYLTYKSINNYYDFNDIEYEALKIIKKENITFNYILIDEFQDTNNLQYEVFINLINENTKTFIVGDPDQSIYQFRGANNKLINKYIINFKATKLLLTKNYRSNKKIIKVANHLINNNKGRIKKELVANSNKDGKINVCLFKNEILEYNYITNEISKFKHSNSIAIIVRNHEQSYFYKTKYYNTYYNISVLTIHESKGLEFDVVFLVGIKDNIIPSKVNLTKTLLEEERRLLFVAITRAKRILYILSSNKFSRFVKEIKDVI